MTLPFEKLVRCNAGPRQTAHPHAVNSHALSFSLSPASAQRRREQVSRQVSLHQRPEYRPSTAILRRWVSWFRVETADIDADPRGAGVTCYARIHSRIPMKSRLRKPSTAEARM